MKTFKSTVLASATALSLSSAAFGAPALSFDQKDIAAVGWSVNYLYSQYDAATNTTTFTYQLTAVSTEKDLSHWVLALNDAPLASSGCTAVKNGLDPTTGVYGWKCDDGQAAGTIKTYTITVSGRVGEANTNYSVKGGTYYAIGSTTGPGAALAEVSTYSISGAAFVDANGNGSMDMGEPRLQNVSVTLSDGQSTRTGLDGVYTFSNLLPGSYGIAVPAQTPSIDDDLNETVNQYFQPTTASTLSVSVGPNATNKNIGFGINTQAVLDDFDATDMDGDAFTFTGTGKTIGFWKHQITSAKLNKTKGVQYSAAAVQEYLYSGKTNVKNMFIEVFNDMPTTTAAAYDYALNILGSTSSNEVELLKKQLLGTELNHQAGRGIGNADLQSVLVAWSEYLVKNSAAFGRDQLLAAKEICDLINNTGE